MDLLRLLTALWRHKTVVVVVLITTLAASVGYLRIAPKVYESSASLTVGPNTAGGGTGEFNGLVDRLLPTLAQLAQGTEVRDAAASSAPATVPIDVRADALQGTLLLRINVKHSDPEAAADWANSIAAELPGYIPNPDLATLKVTEQAQAQLTPVSPVPTLVLPLALLLGLMLAIACAVLLDVLRPPPGRRGFPALDLRPGMSPGAHPMAMWPGPAVGPESVAALEARLAVLEGRADVVGPPPPALEAGPEPTADETTPAPRPAPEPPPVADTSPSPEPALAAEPSFPTEPSIAAETAPAPEPEPRADERPVTLEERLTALVATPLAPEPAPEAPGTGAATAEPFPAQEQLSPDAPPLGDGEITRAAEDAAPRTERNGQTGSSGTGWVRLKGWR